MRFWDEKAAKILFQELQFYNVLIEKPRIKRLKNIDLMRELPFYDESIIVKISQTFKRYARSQKIEIIDSKDPLAQLETNKSNTEDFFKDLSGEIKCFKYQITVKALLSKHKENGSIISDPVYFNSATIRVINSDKYMPDISFQVILYRIDNKLMKNLVG